MQPDEQAAVVAKCATKVGALEVFQAIAQQLKRPPPSFQRLHALLEAWRDPVAIDNGVCEAIEAVDPIVEIRGTTVRALLVAMRVATTQRAAALRRTRSTLGRKDFKPDE